MRRWRLRWSRRASPTAPCRGWTTAPARPTGATFSEKMNTELMRMNNHFPIFSFWDIIIQNWEKLYPFGYKNAKYAQCTETDFWFSNFFSTMFSFWETNFAARGNNLFLLSERLTLLFIIGAELRTNIKPLGIIVLWCLILFREASIGPLCC